MGDSFHDAFFRLEEPQPGLRSAVERGVLSALVGPPTGDPERDRRRVLRLLYLWRERLKSLRQLPDVDAGLRSPYLENCPPAVYCVRPRTRVCGQSSLCPFCYARYAWWLWCRLREFRTGYLAVRLRRARLPGPVTPETLAAALAQVTAVRREAVRVLRPRAALLIGDVLPEAADGKWFVAYRQLYWFPEEPPAGHALYSLSGKVRVFPAGPRSLLRPFVCVLRYPPQLLSAPAPAVCLWRHVRMSVRFRRIVRTGLWRSRDA